ncbi:MAG: hypothetical protein A2790_13850 [Phenylobacterium sp. RIFCSPHIGHO2_01_FULL_69_31]|uniref:nuclear transport factor 2 family protein n=1 Tax=Phenylobacterium sp. RIFCSPHIGHO2_01_FULL_69_31 TaxID=1801944 RepID=UPI0008D78C18|nr:nuclear transport factor 2 family protein [Phenylobacterium sp. RIFCSPHIGHO2_01_FULL_69_31]OHB26938.1 MAG: hypothetical protein A2790_13850 [Phenylobacterium sp. RIFCSPHIGHO2_01_FULL_69_31]
MSAAENKRLMQTAFEALGRGDSRPYLDLLDDDFTFTITGQTPWSRTIAGKAAVRRELFGPLFAQFADQYTAQLVNLIAEGDTVVVEHRGCVTTKGGKLYNNEYCLVCRLENGKLKSVKEYADSLLVDRVLDPPPWAQAEGSA